MDITRCVTSRKPVWGILCCLFLSGCAGFVGGDLKNVPYESHVACEDDKTSYRLSLETNAQNKHTNPASFISGWTFGLIPTYWTYSAKSRATLYYDGEIIDNYSYKSRIHLYYGLVWPLLLDMDGVNSLTFSNVNYDFNGKSDMRNKTVTKAISESGLVANEICYES